MKRFTFAIVLFLLIGLSYSCDENTSKNNDLKKTETLTVPEENTTKTNVIATKTNDLKEMGFNGDIETIKWTDYELNLEWGEEQIGEIRDVYITQFNNDGNKIEENIYDKGVDLKIKYKWTYDENGNLLEKNTYWSGDLYSKTKYTYDENGNLSEENLYGTSGNVWKTKYTYDEKGNKIETKEYGYDGDLDWIYKYTYDENGNLLEQNKCGPKGSVESNTKYTYDEKGNLLEKNEYNFRGSLKRVWKYTYDEKGNRIEMKDYEIVNDIFEDPYRIIKYEIIYR